MAYDARSGRGIKDDESNNSKRKYINGKALPTSGAGTTNTSGLRRSARETLSKKPITASPSPIRKSERLEKRTPPTSPVKKKSERIQKQTMPSPLRRCDRSKRYTSSSSSGSKNSEEVQSSLDMQRGNDKNKSVKGLTEETEEVSRNEKRDLEPANMKRKRMDARTYKALFKMQRRRYATSDCNLDELERPDKSFQDNNTDEVISGSKLVEDAEKEVDKCNGKMKEELREECVARPSEGAMLRSHSSLSDLDIEPVGNQVGLKLSSSEHTEEPHEPSDGDKIKASKSCDMVKEIVKNKGLLLFDSVVGMPQTSEVDDSAPIGRSPDNDANMRSGDLSLTSERRISINMDSDTSATLASKVVSTPLAGSVASTSGRRQQDLVGMCVACSKRRRVGIDAPKQELCSCNLTLNNELGNRSKDRGEPEADVALQHVEKLSNCPQLLEASLDIQMDGQENVCLVCKLGGELLCCDGSCCNRCYHLSCLDPPLDDVPPGVWHCLWCIKKKIESGVHSVSGGIDSIWDVREVEVPEAEGLRRQTQYLVKYKGLAHVHNHWVSEAHLLLETPSLVSNFNRKIQVTRWNAEWAVLHRLIKKRLLIFPKQLEEYQSGHAGNFSDCCYEWLVKWRGLDYENATWELENASFLCSPQGQNLIKEYQNRCERAKTAAVLVHKSRKGSLFQLSELPVRAPSGTECNLLNSVNKLRECWHKCKHGIVFDEQERVIKVVSFILSLSDACLPFIIITASSTLSYWEAEFMRLAPSIDVVVYSGSREARKTLRTMEFQEGGCLILQVLLSSPEGIVEDLEMLGTLRWEAVIIDECQLSKISAHFEQIKLLITDLRVLLFNGFVKDSVAEYLNLLSLLDSHGDLSTSDGLKSDLNNNDLGKLKERLSQFIAYECKSDSSRFVEYWVPVQISNVQLEQYCATLLANSIPLCSSSKNDPIGALRDILISVRKCCDHPYIMDPSLQGLITKDLPLAEYLDVGIKASGKLQLLDMMLLEIKKRQLKVLILFQSISGSGRVSIGDILDDVLRQRFGPDSYERVDGGGVVPSKKQAALNRFNNEAGRFVLLLENRACLPSIKLLSVNAVIIFDSDWTPANDLRALHRVSIESQSRQIKLFRLYSSFTVEEKLLILAKNNMSLDSNLQNISRSFSDTLLMWGASNVFNRLDEFHSNNKLDSCTNISSEESLLTDVVEEFLAILSECGRDDDISNSIISKVRQSGVSCILNIPMLGEQKAHLSEEQPPNIFWTKLLKGKNPRWKYSSGSTQRNRKRVHYYEESPKKKVVGSGEVGKKRKKVMNNSVDPPSLQARLEKGEATVAKEGNSEIQSDYWSPSLPRSTAMADNLSDVLKLEISKLSDCLKLPENVKVMVGRFLEYVIMNHHVNKEPETILQALLISVCWIGVSLSKHKIDMKNSLELAKQHLNFCCKEEEANSIYLRLLLMKKNFLHEAGNIKEINPSEDSVSAAVDDMEEPLDSRMSKSVAFNPKNVKVEIVERSSDEWDITQREHVLNNSMPKKEKAENVRKVKKICKKRWKNLLKRQEDEVQEFNTIWDKKRVQLEADHKLECAFVRSIHSHRSRIDKLKMLEDEFAKKMDEHRFQKDMHLKDLEVRLLAARNDEKQKTAHWLAEARSCPSQNQDHDELPLHKPESFYRVGDFNSEHRADAGSDSVAHVSEQVIEEQHSDGNAHCVQVSVSDIPENCLDRTVDTGITTEPASIPVNQSAKIDEIEQTTLKTPSVVIVKQQNEPTSSADSMIQPSSEEEIADRVLSDIQCKGVQLKNPETAPSDVVGCIDSTEFRTALDSNGVNARTEAVASQNDGTNSIINDDSQPHELSVKSTLVQPVVSTACNCSLAQNPVVMHECSQSLSSSEIQNVDAPDGGKSIIQLVEGSGVAGHPCGGHSSSKNSVSPQLVEGVAHQDVTQTGADLNLHPSVDATDLFVSHNQPDLRSASEEIIQSSGEQGRSFPNVVSSPLVVGDRAETPNQTTLLPSVSEVVNQPCSTHNFSHNAVSTQLADDVVSHSLQVFPDSGAILEVDPSIDCTDLTHGQNQPDVRSANRDNFSSDELNTSPDSLTVPQLIENTAEFPNQTILQPVSHLAVTQGHHNLPMHSAHQGVSRMPTVPFVADPLQNELERIRKEMEQAVKVHEDLKLQLKSECDKEIEEVVAQIRIKYEAKLQDAEAAFLLKKNELDKNQNEVLMNKILAEAFRSKCLNLGPFRGMGTQQGTHYSFMQHLHLLSLPSSVRAPVTSLYSTGQPAAGRQITSSSVRAHHSAAPCTSTHSRPPHISPITPFTSNLQSSRDIRAPAPHLQPFRSSTCLTATIPTSLPRRMSNQQVASNLAVTSHSLPHHPPRLVPPPPLPPPLPTNLTGSFSRAPTGSAGQVPSPCSFSMSAPELPADVDNQPNVCQTNVLQPLPDYVSNVDSLILSDFGKSGPIQNSLASSSAGTDVVCLSDDD